MGLGHAIVFRLLVGFGGLLTLFGAVFFIYSEFYFIWGIILGIGIVLVHLSYLFYRKHESKV